MTERQAYVEKYQAKLDQWDNKIQELKAQAAEAAADAKIKYEEEIRTLETYQEQAQKNLDDLRNTAGDKWIDTKFNVEKAYDDFDRSIRKTIEKIVA